MAKTRKQRITRSKNAFTGCIPGFIGVFDFGHSRSTHFLITDHWVQRNVEEPLTNAGDKIKLTTSIQKSEFAAEGAKIDKEESRAAGTKDSVMVTCVKTLMEEDHLLKLMRPKKKLLDFVLKQIKRNLVLHDNSLKNSKKNRKAEMVVQIFPLIEEFCTGSIYYHYLLSNQDIFRMQPHLKDSVLYERLREGLEVFLSNKYVEAFEVTALGTTQSFDALMNAIEVMHAHKNFILQILQDSSSDLFKYIPSLKNAQSDKLFPSPKSRNSKLIGWKDKIKKENICGDCGDSLQQIILLKPCQSSTDPGKANEKARMKLENEFLDVSKEKNWLFVGNMGYKHGISDSANRGFKSRRHSMSSLSSIEGVKGCSLKDGQPLEHNSIYYSDMKRKLMEMLKIDDEEENLKAMNECRALRMSISSPGDMNSNELSPRRSKDLNSQTECTCSCESPLSNSVSYLLPLKSEEAKIDVEVEEYNQREVNDIKRYRKLVNEQKNNFDDAQIECDKPGVAGNSDQESILSYNELMVENLDNKFILPGSSSASYIEVDGFDIEDKHFEKPENISPNSVLEPFSLEDANTGNLHEEIDDLHILPKKLHFEADDGGIQNVSTSQFNFSPIINNQEKDATVDYIRNLLLASGLNCNDPTYAPLDSSLMDQVDAPFSQIPEYHKLLFDCVNEVLQESYAHLFGCCPWISVVQMGIHSFPCGQKFIQEVSKRIASYLVHQGVQTLNQMIKKDMIKNTLWMDFRFDAEDVALKIGHSIVDKLMEESILELWD